MGDVRYTDEQQSILGRVGGFYQNLDELEADVSLKSFNVLVGPKTKRGYFMVPAPHDTEEAS